MKQKDEFSRDAAARVLRSLCGATHWALIVVVAAAIAGCGTRKASAKKDDFFTSGSREADQRASQRMARQEQLSGTGEGSGEKGVKKAKTEGGENLTNRAAQVEGKLALYDRLGGEEGLSKIVADFMPRALQDPRVNWERRGTKSGGWFSRRDRNSVQWKPTPENTRALQTHIVQFLALATGGPSRYDGKEMKSTHAAMHITNAEFDAAIGDLKASLDRLQIPNKEQKELLAIVESTRPQIVTQK